GEGLCWLWWCCSFILVVSGCPLFPPGVARVQQARSLMGTWPLCVAGVCPSPLGFGPCVDLCFADVQCRRGQKCCSNGCGHVCMTAITGGKPGLCPEPQGKGICVERCREDEECPRGQKCCSNGCGHVCTSPIFSPAGWDLLPPSPHPASACG
uniref:WAP domain-containing protein n=1 Tax=Gopherus evgoodei TaxID=1825980 RepID=A0A8C4VWI5_9SAUR